MEFSEEQGKIKYFFPPAIKIKTAVNEGSFGIKFFSVSRSSQGRCVCMCVQCACSSWMHGYPNRNNKNKKEIIHQFKNRPRYNYFIPASKMFYSIYLIYILKLYPTFNIFLLE